MAQQIKEIDLDREFDQGKLQKMTQNTGIFTQKECYKAIVDFGTEQNRQPYECLVMLSQAVKPKLLGLLESA